MNFAQFRKDCNVSCSSCARRVNTTHFSGSSFPTIVKTISREEKYKMKCHIIQRHQLLFHGLRLQPRAHVNSIAHWLCVLYVEPLSLTAPMVSGNTQGHFGKEKRSNFFKTRNIMLSMALKDYYYKIMKLSPKEIVKNQP